MSVWLTVEQMVDESSGRGYDVTARQIESWRALAIVPCGRQEGLGRGAGSRRLYPHFAQERLLAFLALRRPRELLAETAVRMWLRGHEFARDDIRAFLRRTSVPGRIKREIAKRGVVGYGEGLAEDARRKPKVRMKFGDESATALRNVQEFGEGIARMFLEPSAAIPEKMITSLADQLTPSQSDLTTRFGLDLPADFSETFPLIASDDFDCMSDDVLNDARTLWTELRDLAELSAGFPDDYVVLSELRNGIFPQLDSAWGFFLCIQVLRRDTELAPASAIANIRALNMKLRSGGA